MSKIIEANIREEIRVETRVEKSEILPPIDQYFLNLIRRHPRRPSTDFSKLMNMAPCLVLKIRRRLKRLGYLTEENQNNQKAKGRSITTLHLTEKATQFFRSSNNGI